MINIAGKLCAKTADGYIADGTNLEFVSGATSPNGTSVTEAITKLIKSQKYLTQDAYDALVESNQIENDVEYNILDI